MLDQQRDRSTNCMFIEAPITTVWSYVATSAGWNSYLSDIAESARLATECFQPGDAIRFVIGELTNYAICAESTAPNRIVFDDRYAAMFPDGTSWEYRLRTAFDLEEMDGQTRITVTVIGYTKDEMMQWVRECGEMGWRQSLFNLKCLLELGLDLRNDIFNYPRLGVFNYSATKRQLEEQGLDRLQQRGNYLKIVYPGGPAAESGLQTGDIITHLDGEEVPLYHDFVRVLSRHYRQDEPLSVRYYRNGCGYICTIPLTYSNQFTGMIDPNEVDLKEVAIQRQAKSSTANGLTAEEQG